MDFHTYPGAGLALKVANRILVQNAWALPRLQKFAGQTAEISVAPFVFRVQITEAGLLAFAPDASSDVSIRLNPADVPLFVAQRKIDARKTVIEGDATFASELSAVMENLRLDKEEWMSRVTGDIVAHRLGRAMDAAAAWPGYGGRRLLENLGEYATEEAQWLAKNRNLTRFAADVDILRDDVARLEKRIERLLRRKPS